MARAKANKALAEQRTDDVLRIILDGAMHHDVVAFVREKEREPGSAWFVGEDGTPLSDGMIRRYQERAYRLIDQSHATSRKRLFRRHVAQLRNLFSRATTSGELSVARAVLRDLAEIQRLYPQPEDELRREVDQLRDMVRKLTDGTSTAPQGDCQSAPADRGTPDTVDRTAGPAETGPQPDSQPSGNESGCLADDVSPLSL
jgi:hypothetical protein